MAHHRDVPDNAGTSNRTDYGQDWSSYSRYPWTKGTYFTSNTHSDEDDSQDEAFLDYSFDPRYRTSDDWSTRKPESNPSSIVSASRNESITDYSPDNYLNNGNSQPTYPNSQVEASPAHRDLNNSPELLGPELMKLYTLRVPKGKTAFHELKPGYMQFSATLPPKISLDQADSSKTNGFVCQLAESCGGKTSIFKRTADLERHYKNMHTTPDQERWSCDYKKCDRFKNTFSRKDHYRDHLKDFHKEDIVSPRRMEMKRGSKITKDNEEAEYKWFDSRNVDQSYWRCARCLLRVYPQTDGGKCPTCIGTCEEVRVGARKKRGDLVVEEGFSPKVPDCTTCVGLTLIVGDDDKWLPCPTCLPGEAFGVNDDQDEPSSG